MGEAPVAAGRRAAETGGGPTAERLYLSGPETIVTLLRLQKEQDRANGLDTAGFVSGYRGSPLGGLDFALWRNRDDLARLQIRFEPGLNEELAVNAVWGSQQTEIYGGGPHQGVFGLWYAKNPGLDRAADAIKHASFDGAHQQGGVLAVVGDDPAASSSSIPNQCEQAFIAAAIPVLHPVDAVEILEFGLAGYALSRFSGLWVGLKLVADLVDTSASVTLPDLPLSFALPNDVALPETGLGPRWPNTRWDQDTLLHRYKLPAVRAFARANPFDRTEIAPSVKRLGFVAAGKPYRDLREAFALLGLADCDLADLGIGLRKIGLVWPLEDAANGEFLRGFDKVIVVEEKRAVIETQAKDLAFSWPDGERPQILGKTDETEKELVTAIGETDPRLLARLVAPRIAGLPDLPEGLRDHLNAAAAELAAEAPAGIDLPARTPHFCAGCPHARSTATPEGSVATAGIGCHSMVMWAPESRTATIPQMGGEGANWIGAANFTDCKHVFQNLGDGTYMHSGSLAIRAAVAANVPITYKILVNDAVAMTGGQPVEGAPSAADIAHQLHAEGVAPIYIVTGRSADRPAPAALPPGVRLRDRDDLAEVMADCRTLPGVSAIIYDQICATEKRRHRKSGRWAAPEPAVIINHRVCEDCGDCSDLSHCVAVRRRDTPFGTKRRIDASTCNTDLSCLDGFCPSFVTVTTDRPPPPKPATAPPAAPIAALPVPAALDTAAPYGIVIAGVGGTGLVTLGAIIGRAAHFEGRAVSALDITGLARKGGEVTTHIRIGANASDLAARLPDGAADLLIAGDLACAAGPGGVAKLKPGGHAVLLDDAVPMVAQAFDPSATLPVEAYRARIGAALGAERAHCLDANAIAEKAFGETIFGNMVLLGAAAQLGLLPVDIAAIQAAIAAHGVAAEKNRIAFDWGRLAAADLQAVAESLGLTTAADAADDPIELFAAELAAYQSVAYADRYRRLVENAAEAETAVSGAPGRFTETVSRTAYRLMAYKDEYEVARLLTDPAFVGPLTGRTGDRSRLAFYMAPPFVPVALTADGRRGKRRFGGWLLPGLQLMARMKGLRGTPLDIFGYQQERRTERRLVSGYAALVEELCSALTAANLEAATELAALPATIRGFGHIKTRTLKKAAASFPARRAAFLDSAGTVDKEIGAELWRALSPYHAAD